MDNKELTDIEKLKIAALELAELASYAEIVNGISVNRSGIRKYCDEIFDISKRLEID